MILSSSSSSSSSSLSWSSSPSSSSLQRHNKIVHNIRICSQCREGGEESVVTHDKIIIIIIIRMVIFVIELDLWDSNIVFLCKCFRISEWHISGTGGQIWLLKKAKSIRMQKIIISMIMFLIHMYLWGIDAVFLWRYPHISNGTNFELEGWNQVLAEANYSTSSSGWSYF